MRIILDIDEAKDAKGKKAVRCRTKWYANSADPVAVHNSGVEIYDALKEIFDTAFVGGIMEHKGEQK